MHTSKVFILLFITTALTFAVGLFAIIRKQITEYIIPVVPFFVNSDQDVVHLFPKNVETLHTWVARAKKRAQEETEKVLAIPASERTFENTAQAIDRINFYFQVVLDVNEAIGFVYPDDTLRNVSRIFGVEMKQFALDLFSQNKELYRAFNEYINRNMKSESLSPEQIYFIEETMKGFKQSGLHLPEETQAKINKLFKEIAELTTEFQKNIDEDNSFIVATKAELAGLDEDFIACLPQDDKGNYILYTNYPNYFNVMEQCSVSSTRKKFFEAFNNRAYPQNEKVLKDLIAARDEVARLLGYESYAVYNLDNQMAKDPNQAQKFLESLIERSQVKTKKELALLSQDLPEGVHLADGKLNPWDVSYVVAQYKKKNFNIENKLIAEYFPVESTLDGLLKIYQAFFGIDFIKKDTKGFWDPSVQLIEVRQKKDQKTIGYLLLDLFPRPNKYSHACELTIVPGFKMDENMRVPTVAMVIGNFPAATDCKPALLELSEVRTFFHEFGHAIHAVLGGKVPFAAMSGTATKRDFVEMPSQMLEEWLWDAETIKNLSSHYQTGQSLPDEKIQTIIALKNFTSGLYVLQQLIYAFVSLDYYGPGRDKVPHALMNEIRDRILPYLGISPHDNRFASFGHLTGYGAQYYGYLWSKVFALDLFEYIKPFGLLNPQIGDRYQEAILSKGGTKDPNELLEEFLGRKPSSDAFFKDLGI